MSSLRVEFTAEEELAIVDYIVRNEQIHRIKGDKLWKEMEESGKFHHTWSSLKNHFCKTMIKELHFPRYQLDEVTHEMFHGHYYSVSIRKSKKPSLRPERQDPGIPNFLED